MQPFRVAFGAIEHRGGLFCLPAAVLLWRPQMSIRKRHHLDRRADAIAAQGTGVGAPDDLLTTAAVARWLGVSNQWVEIGRTKGYGPPFKRIGPFRIRYLRSDVLAWLEQRTH